MSAEVTGGGLVVAGQGRDYDAESLPVDVEKVGAPVDPPDERPSVFVTVTTRTASGRRPIVPAWMRNAQQRAQFVRWALDFLWYAARFHAWHSPMYAGRALVWAPVGVARLAGRQVAWWWDTTAFRVEQAAVDKDDPATFFKARREGNARRLFRGIVLAAELTAVALAVSYLYAGANRWAQLLTLAVVLPLLARVGRPADKPIIDRVTEGPRFVKLTAEMVRAAIVAAGIQGVKDPAAMTFPQEIRRDGPGYLAVVDLPRGITASKVLEHRPEVSSGLRLPLDQVWPAEMPEDHPGRVALWVGDQPASKVPPPTWPLLRAERVDAFAPFPFGTTPRQVIVDGELVEQNWLFGGVPGSGKTVAMRNVVLAAALDPMVELRGYELKGTGDFDVLTPLCAEYGSGQDDETAEAALNLLRWLRQECGRRSKRIKHFAARGMAPDNKVTPELARMKGSGLHLLVAWIDEVQELFSHEEYGKEAQSLAPKIVKLARALGIIVLLGTQRPDKESMPPALTALMNTRFCLKVMDQVANDMILGTSMYKNGYRATQFRPKVDAGWGIAVGPCDPAPVRSFYVNNASAKAIVERALRLRQDAGTVPAPEDRERVPVYNLLEDVRQVMLPGEDAVWSELIVPRLAQLRPEIYGDWVTVNEAGETEVHTGVFGAAMRAAGCPTVSIHRKVEGKGTTRYGVRGDELQAAIDRKAVR